MNIYEMSPSRPAPEAIIAGFSLYRDQQCAWCVEEMERELLAAGLPVPERSGSHGICEIHAPLVWSRWQEARAVRKQERH